MKLKKLDQQFYIDHAHLVEALDNANGNWTKGKTRGYGIVVITINTLTFAIPLRSNIRHKAAYITVKSNAPGVYGKGLDFSKALLITNNKYISNAQFNIDAFEHKTLAGKEHFIAKKFEKYVENYVSAIQHNRAGVLKRAEYRFTTLQNYHTELKI